MHSTILPGSAVPRVCRTPARVAAVYGSSPGIDAPVPGLSSGLNVRNSSSNAGLSHGQSFTTPSSVYDHLSYEPYVEPTTNIRTTVPIHTDPVTGIRHALAAIPAGFVHEAVLWTRSDPQVADCPISSAIRRCLGMHDSTAPPTVRTSVPQPPYNPAGTPGVSRHLAFASPDHLDPTSPEQDDGEHSYRKLTTSELASIDGRSLELEDVPTFIADLKVTLGRVDTAAHVLLSSADPHAILAVGDAWALEANKRIAAALFSAFDVKGKNVQLLKARIRKAEASDRPGISFSGVDILEEITSLIHDRTIGEIKLNTVAIEPVKFKAGKSIDDTRLLADKIEKQFALKTAAERAVPNALHHEMISKIPDFASATLDLKKQTYEDDLYKAEMIGEAPPWELARLIDYIAVDLARVPASTKEVALAAKGEQPPRPDPKPRPTLTSTYKCAACGAVGKHLSFDCPIKCPECALNFCPGARHELCAVVCETPPSKRSPPLENVHGRPLHSMLVQKLDAAWKLKHPGKEVSSLEVEADSDEDTEVFGLVHPSA